MSSLPLFIEKVCPHRGACVTCRRQDEAGTKWRAAMSGAMETPAPPAGKTAGEFECPYGLPWGVSAEAAKAAPRLTLERIAHGAIGIAKAVAGFDRSSPELIEQRTATCMSCPHAVLHGGNLATCRLCGCRLNYKLRLASEKCPDGRW